LQEQPLISSSAEMPTAQGDSPLQGAKVTSCVAVGYLRPGPRSVYSTLGCSTPSTVPGTAVLHKYFLGDEQINVSSWASMEQFLRRLIQDLCCLFQDVT
jgi:hypothetical protein